MKIPRCKFVLIPVLLLLFCSSSIASTVGDRVLDDVEISTGANCSNMEIYFTIPMRYVKHFPPESGEDLRIQIRPVTVGTFERNELDRNNDAFAVEREGIFGRESIRPSSETVTDLLEVSYEGDITDGPFLTLTFKQEVFFHVSQGSDFRSLEINIYRKTDESNASDCM